MCCGNLFCFKGFKMEKWRTFWRHKGRLRVAHPPLGEEGRTRGTPRFLMGNSACLTAKRRSASTVLRSSTYTCLITVESVHARAHCLAYTCEHGQAGNSLYCMNSIKCETTTDVNSGPWSLIFKQGGCSTQPSSKITEPLIHTHDVRVLPKANEISKDKTHRGWTCALTPKICQTNPSLPSRTRIEHASHTDVCTWQLRASDVSK